MIKHISCPDIKQFRELIRAVKSRAQFAGLDSNGDAIYDPLRPIPTLEFSAIHGSNAKMF